MQLVCFSWVGFSVWEFSADAALESSCSTQTRPSLVLLVCRWRGAPAGTNEFVCVGQRSSRPSKLDQLVSVGHTCAESRVCERQTFTLCVCFSQTPVFAAFYWDSWTFGPMLGAAGLWLVRAEGTGTPPEEKQAWGRVTADQSAAAVGVSSVCVILQSSESVTQQPSWCSSPALTVLLVLFVFILCPPETQKKKICEFGILSCHVIV